jgi:hypothetical protein
MVPCGSGAPNSQVPLGRELVVLSGRTRRVLIYTAALLVAPVPVMPYEKGTREYALAIMACGAILMLSSFYVLRGEWRLKQRGLLGNKLLATSLITLLFGMFTLAVSIIQLGRA